MFVKKKIKRNQKKTISLNAPQPEPMDIDLNCNTLNHKTMK